MNKTIFMFHAIGEVSKGDWADPNYSYSKDKFKELLKKLGSVSSLYDSIDLSSNTKAIFTFDDGHVSNYWAAKLLFDGGYGSADFFINPELIGSDYYMDWSQIRELKSMGMSIQSHGLDHQYLSSCSDHELHRQLSKSKEIIENAINTSVTILAPPGGRFDNRTIRLAKEIGYSCIANSIPGHFSNNNDFLFPRIAVMKDHTCSKLISLMNPYSLIVYKIKLKYAILKLLKNIFGDTFYEKVRWKILGGN